MKIIFITHKWQARTGESCVRALQEMGHETKIAYAKIGAVSLYAKLYYRLKRSKLIGTHLSNIEMQVLNAHIIKTVCEFCPDLIINNAGGEVFPETLEIIRKKTHAKLVCWAGDDPSTYQLSNNYLAGMKHYDNYFMVDPSWYSADLKSIGLKKCSILQYGVDPEIYTPVVLSLKEKKKLSSDVCHLGSPHNDRIVLLRQLLDYDLSLWGATSTKLFKNFSKLPSELLPKVRSGVVPAHVSNKIYNASKICLNIQHQQVSCAHSNKTFEIAASGAFLITSLSPAHDNSFAPGELITFNGISELRKLIDYYLANESERESIAKLAYTRTMNNHLYKHRMLQMLAEAGF
ncbi:glycosyltransferase [Trichlorobacter lovleyi]|uniref:CgeB family protein n=1 Tax=Trichlorobacter lovleyi TaxID=313985 RepID=UPI0024815DD2|nr:glycosyltransferase [Trichlorobacter lovleyi]